MWKILDYIMIKHLYHCVSFEIGEYRRVFEGIRQRTNQQIGNTLLKSEIFKESYNLFISCQGRHLDLGNRMNKVQEMLDYFKNSKEVIDVTYLKDTIDDEIFSSTDGTSSVLKVQVEHFRPSVGDFEARIIGNLT